VLGDPSRSPDEDETVARSRDGHELPAIARVPVQEDLEVLLRALSVPGGLQVGGEVPVEDQIIQALIDGQPFEATLPGIVVTTNTLGPIPAFAIEAGSNVAGDQRTLLIQFAFDPETMSGGTFRTALELLSFNYAPAPGALFGLDVDPMTLLTTGVVEVTGNVDGKISGTFSANLIPVLPNMGPGVSITSGVFAVRETPVGGSPFGGQ